MEEKLHRIRREGHLESGQHGEEFTSSQRAHHRHEEHEDLCSNET